MVNWCPKEKEVKTMVTDDKGATGSKDKRAKKATESDKKGFDLDEGKITR